MRVSSENLNHPPLNNTEGGVYMEKLLQNCVLHFDLIGLKGHEYFNLNLSRNKCKNILGGAEGIRIKTG